MNPNAIEGLRNTLIQRVKHSGILRDRLRRANYLTSQGPIILEWQTRCDTTDNEAARPEASMKTENISEKEKRNKEI